jgi:hypothetical protein
VFFTLAIYRRKPMFASESVGQFRWLLTCWRQFCRIICIACSAYQKAMQIFQRLVNDEDELLRETWLGNPTSNVLTSPLYINPCGQDNMLSSG